MKVKLIHLNTFEVKTEKEMILLGYRFSKKLKPDDIIILEGPIGAGKTTFIKGVAKGLGCKEMVISSSFNLMREYKGKNVNLLHYDFYRINGNYDINEIVENINGNNIIAIEWPYKIENYIEFKPYIVRIDFTLKSEVRKMEIFKI